jgi:hypothetical protein
MFLRMRQRVARLEQAIVPKGRVLAFVWDGTSPLGSYAEQLAAFKARNDVGPRDTLIEVVITFGADLQSRALIADAPSHQSAA